MSDYYKKSIEFWNEQFNNLEVSPIKEKFILFDSFNNTIKKYIKENDYVLDFGCGDGWCVTELFYTIDNIKGLGIDQSENAINYAKEIVKVSNIKNIEFVKGDELLLDNYKDVFDAAISVNCIDVIPDDIVRSILSHIKDSLKSGAYFIVCINPDFDESFLSSIGYIKEGQYLYKNGILRGNEHSKEEWIDIFKEYFSFIEYNEFEVVEKDLNYKRRMFILKKETN